MTGNTPGENFLGDIFRGGEVDGIFQGVIPSGVIFLEPFSSHNVSILIFQKIINKYNKTLTKRCIL